MKSPEDLLNSLANHRLESVVQFEKTTWTFAFSGRSSLRVECPWRIVVNGAVAVTGKDHAQLFGREAPVDSCAESLRLLEKTVVKKAEVAVGSGDLVVIFENGARLELFTDSCGYESWHLCSPDGELVALGGGNLAVL